MTRPETKFQPTGHIEADYSTFYASKPRKRRPGMDRPASKTKKQRAFAAKPTLQLGEAWWKVLAGPVIEIAKKVKRGNKYALTPRAKP